MKIHIVKQGDTLYELAQKYGVPLEKLIEANPQLTNPDVLNIGDKVKIPVPASPVPESGELYHKHTVKQGDTLWKLSKAWGIQLKDLIEANPHIKNPDVLKIGDVINIPKKPAAPPAHVGTTTGSVAEKTTPGGKAYTGPIEQPHHKAPTAPIEKAPTTPIEKAPTAPIEKAPTAPIPQPVPVPAPPVTETVHTETQSLFVQISVPAQEAVVLPEVKPVEPSYCPPEPPKSFCGCPPVPVCDKSYGYPGITENPNYYDCPTAYPIYESIQPTPYMPGMVQPAGFMPGAVQPSGFMPESMAPYCYPEPTLYAQPAPFMDSAASPQFFPGVVPGYSADQSAGGFMNFPAAPEVSPAFVSQAPAMPWPSCGCGGDYSGIQPVPYAQGGFDAPGYGSMPEYSSQPVFQPSFSGMPQSYMMPQTAADSYQTPMVSGIPPIPQYPGAQEGMMLDRQPVETVQAAVTEIQDPAPAAEETRTAERSKPKVKTSARSTETKSGSTSKKQTGAKAKNNGAKKRRNPWISG
ncbi:LysM peptidoglycan-binding domain-containing protein [Paenibacillus sp. HN-1]|uniref:LysM peptidoglycan-binding domain-containing protein n=1 Tax=Paenibacillus TaxID=44249 RepID=UPI001CA998CF|nr:MULTISPECIES: LysM peptidoglycan-binding domain-containing protein [Paenibacillus]MBY9079368.1 LysM peptidoglycan-binding domain-containing protein [Paenibacillus sp. CGMCC 1.18879]MBY9085663.1 LysM peptidoglycan-binding domain-containing protein [Paenibacillus sinensis]